MYTATCSAGPNLALIKYWGKVPGDSANIPATTSIGLTLSTLRTYTRVSIGGKREHGPSTVSLNGKPEPLPQPFLVALLSTIQKAKETAPDMLVDLPADPQFSISSTNNFSTSAGLASSASGYAALAAAGFAAALVPAARRSWIDSLQGPANAAIPGLPTARDLSALARQGSGSASRSVFAGFCTFAAGQHYAEPLFDEEHWPEIRSIVLTISAKKKAVSSRAAMEAARNTSPYYKAWVESAPALAEQATLAIRRRDLAALGPLMRASYLQMFGTMFSSQPPLLYWHPASVAVLHRLEELRASGLQAWETMDAGPQVKIFTLEPQAQALSEALRASFPDIQQTLCAPGRGIQLEDPPKQ